MSVEHDTAIERHGQRPVTSTQTSPAASIEPTPSGTGRAAIVANIGWLLSGRIYSLVLGFVAGVAVARYMGADEFGLLNYTIAFVALFRVVANLGLEEIVVRELVRHPEQRNEILGTVFGLRLASGLATIAIIILGVRLARPDDALACGLVAVASLANLGQAAMVIQRWNTANVKAKYNVWASQFSLTAATSAKLLLILFSSSLVWFVWTNVLMVWVNAALLVLYYVRTGDTTSDWRFSRRWATRLLRDAWPRIPAGIAGTVQTQAGAVLIGTMLGDQELGVYSVALRLFMLLVVLPNIVCQTFSPALTRARAAGQQEFDTQLVRIYRMVVQLFAVTALIVALFGPQGIRILFGGEYEDAGFLLVWMLVPCFLVFAGAVRIWFIVVENLFMYSMYLSIIQSIATLLVYYVAIDRLGALGAVLGLGVSGAIGILADVFHPVARHSTTALIRGAASFWVLPR